MEHVTARLKELVDRYAGGKPTVFAKNAGIHHSTFLNYLKGRNPSAEHLCAIRDTYGVSIDWILTGEGAPDGRGAVNSDKGAYTGDRFAHIPFVEPHLNAGGEVVMPAEGMRDASYAFRKPWLDKIATSARNLVLMAMSGASMEPTLKDGDIVMIDRGRQRILPGLVYALGIEDTIIIKRIEVLTGGRLMVLSDNRAEYPPYEASTKDIRVLGQIIWFARQLVWTE